MIGCITVSSQELLLFFNSCGGKLLVLFFITYCCALFNIRMKRRKLVEDPLAWITFYTTVILSFFSYSDSFSDY